MEILPTSDLPVSKLANFTMIGEYSFSTFGSL